MLGVLHRLFLQNKNKTKMTKKLLYLFVALISISGIAQNTYVPDDKFEQALIDLGYDSGALDDYVPTANISGVTSLNINEKQIEDLTGIEDFLALKQLSIIRNRLTSLDLSKNTELNYLFAYGNFLLGTLDVSNNIKLNYLNLGNSGLTAIDVTKNTALQYLYLQSNTLTSIDLSKNLELIVLWLYSNKLENLNLTNNTKITGDLQLNNNLLESIDLSKNVDIQSLKIYNNKLKELDVSLLSKMTYLDVRQNLLLESLNVKNGANTILTDFKATNVPKLTCIQVDDATYSTTNWTNKDATATYKENCTVAVATTYVPDDNFEQALIDLGYDSGALDDYVPTTNIEAVTRLDIRNKSIVDLTGIEDFTALKTLIAENNNLTTIDVRENIRLEGLFINKNQISTVDLSKNTALKELFLNNNKLASIDLSKNIAINNLELSSNKLATIDLSVNISLLYVYLGSNDLVDIDLSKNTLLEEVYVGGNLLLETINLKNRSNTSITDFAATNTPKLTCIEVDDAIYSTTNWKNKDATATYKEDCSATVATTHVPDDNFEQALIDLGYDVGVLDNYVPTANIDNVVSLPLAFKSNINDFTGLEDFISLEDLDVSGHKFSTIDLSKNIALKKLSIRETEVLTIDVSNNVNLEEISGYSSSLKNLDLSKNTAITKVAMSEAELERINISNCTELKNLILYDNNIAILDVSSNLKLEYLLVENNKLKNLDLSGNNNLINLRGYNNLLESLNIKNGNNTLITSFRIDRNPNLTCIQVDNATYSITNWTNKDATAVYNEDCSSLSVDDFGIKNNITIYPNPVVDYVHIKNTSIEDIQVHIYNMIGKKMLSTIINKTNDEIDMRNFNSGIYFIRMNNIFTKKIVKK